MDASLKIKNGVEVPMENVPVACLIIITIITIYFPLAHIRLSNKILRALEKIENNTHKG